MKVFIHICFWQHWSMFAVFLRGIVYSASVCSALKLLLCGFSGLRSASHFYCPAFNKRIRSLCSLRPTDPCPPVFAFLDIHLDGTLEKRAVLKMKGVGPGFDFWTGRNYSSAVANYNLRINTGSAPQNSSVHAIHLCKRVMLGVSIVTVSTFLLLM